MGLWMGEGGGGTSSVISKKSSCRTSFSLIVPVLSLV